jgi:dihydrofolate reductase
MRKLVFQMHISLDSYVAGMHGELDWIKLDEEMFDFVNILTNNADTALYGRVTYQIMNNYWPEAGMKPNASKHDIEHSSWYNRVSKIVLSNTLKNSGQADTTFISGNVIEKISRLKQQKGRNIIIFGSPSVSNLLLNEGLVDEFWLFINPVVLGDGISLFRGGSKIIKLEQKEVKTFKFGVTAIHYAKL